MFVSDAKKEFYNIICQQHVLVLVSFDVDALCAWKILQFLLKCDDVTYTLVPVNDAISLQNAYVNNSQTVKHVVLLNCAATINILELLQPPEDITFYVIDSHRPLDIFNFYNASQVKLILNSNEESINVPAFDDLFNEDDTDEEESASDSEDSQPKRKKFDEEYLEKRRTRRLWEERRGEILEDYLHSTYHGPSSAILLFDLAWKMSKDNNELLWWAIVGLTEQFLSNKIDSNTYILECGELQTHIARLNPREENISLDCIKISFDKELFLSLYRHWSVYESFRHTMYTVCKFKSWMFRGERRLHEFLADLGVPLIQVKQKFSCMDLQFKKNLLSWIEAKANKYGLNEIIFGSFHIKQGYKYKFWASDIVHALNAHLESADDNKVPAERFHDAVDCLSRSNDNLLYKGLELAKQQLEVIYRQVKTFLSGGVGCVGPFLYATIDTELEYCYFSHPNCLINLSRFILNVQMKTSKNKKIRVLPLVLSAPALKDKSKCIVVGIPPYSSTSTKNFFGKAFEKASNNSRCEISLVNFDTSIILLKKEDRGRFMDSLINLLN